MPQHQNPHKKQGKNKQKKNSRKKMMSWQIDRESARKLSAKPKLALKNIECQKKISTQIDRVPKTHKTA